MNFSLLSRVTLWIWIRTIFMNTFLLLFVLLYEGNYFQSFLITFFVFFGSLVVTAPLLFIIYYLIKFSVAIPYSGPGKRTWLTFCLILLACSFYFGIGMLTGDPFFNDEVFQMSIAAIAISISISVYWSRNGLKNLSQQFEMKTKNKYY